MLTVGKELSVGGSYGSDPLRDDCQGVGSDDGKISTYLRDIFGGGLNKTWRWMSRGWGGYSGGKEGNQNLRKTSQATDAFYFIQKLK